MIQVLIVNNLKLSVDASSEVACSIAIKKLRRVGINLQGAEFHIYKRSIDARKKDEIKFVYSVAVRGDFPNISSDKLSAEGITLEQKSDLFDSHFGDEILSAPPLIVGSGPCGLFAALILAENGYSPILIERGGSVDERICAIDRFKKFGILDPETNIQFGAGGAGTFSDGKLVTRINDPASSYVLEKFVEFGAPEEILYLAKPHIGTDILEKIIRRITDRIISLGGKILYHTKLISLSNNSTKKIALTNKGEIEYGAIILAIGHSARDTYESLLKENFAIEAKPFSVGMRIEHHREKIDCALYGKYAGHPALGAAEYNLSYNTKVRGVYTFCMCPGGEVVCAASEEGGVVVNGMSRHKRNGINSNSAVVCSVFKEDYGKTPLKAIEFQRKIERAAFYCGGEDYSAPIITVGDFLKGECKREPYSVFPTYADGNRVKFASPEKFLPEFVTNGIKDALLDFDKKIQGFAESGAILTGAETRTSAPIRILRDPDSRIALNNSYVYPAGEGAGYAGGITSAAIDGIRTAIAVMKRFSRERSNG